MNSRSLVLKPSSVAPLFYFGTLVSSVGSFAFNVALIAFMLRSGFHLGEASLIIAAQRFRPVLINAAWGHLTDSFSPCAIVAIAEGIAALSSVCLLIIWKGAGTSYFLLATLCIVRAIVVAFQVGSRSKITKYLSDESIVSNFRNAIWLNKATQGATLFGGFAGWVIIHYFSFKTAIVFDAITFLINGAIAFLIPNFEGYSKALNHFTLTWHQKFNDLFSFNRRSATLDILLMIPMMGTVAFMARLAGSDQSWIGIYMAGYGLAVWVSGYLERGITTKVSTFPFWIIMGASFIALGQLHSPSIMTLVILFFRDLAFWIIFHRISGHIQMDTPADRTGSVMSARNCIMTAILTSGEVLVGVWSNYVPIAAESLVRGMFAVSVSFYLFAMRVQKTACVDRPAL